ncbi:hypothetical protein RRG08_059818 [Elysia crispata]|uniref:Uncharacterized protein n=1 Tax=Elysia crispata TaxID=231223 RepID=A0AAE1EEN1_9GAST|nr:hypothetical protein RRG08_059818 [Elysia crispata]
MGISAESQVSQGTRFYCQLGGGRLRLHKEEPINSLWLKIRTSERPTDKARRVTAAPGTMEITDLSIGSTKAGTPNIHYRVGAAAVIWLCPHARFLSPKTTGSKLRSPVLQD